MIGFYPDKELTTLACIVRALGDAMIDEGTLESCYGRTAPVGQNAACQRLTREK